MKINGDKKIDSCFSCRDLQFSTLPEEMHECMKDGRQEKYASDLYLNCPLPEGREIKIWFSKRPPEAAIFDVCVYFERLSAVFDCSVWVIELFTGLWVRVAVFEKKEQAEKYLACKIPEWREL